MSSVVNLKMFIFVVLILTNCLAWHDSYGAAASSIVMTPSGQSSVIGDIAETHKFVESDAAHESKDDGGSTTTSTTPPSTITTSTDATSSESAKDIVVPPPLGGPVPTGSASSRFNVDLRGSSILSAPGGAIQSPTTFIGGDRMLHPLAHYGLRRKPQSLTAVSSLSATKSAFDEKSKIPN